MVADAFKKFRLVGCTRIKWNCFSSIETCCPKNAVEAVIRHFQGLTYWLHSNFSNAGYSRVSFDHVQVLSANREAVITAIASRQQLGNMLSSPASTCHASIEQSKPSHAQPSTARWWRMRTLPSPSPWKKAWLLYLKNLAHCTVSRGPTQCWAPLSASAPYQHWLW